MEGVHTVRSVCSHDERCRLGAVSVFVVVAGPVADPLRVAKRRDRPIQGVLVWRSAWNQFGHVVTAQVGDVDVGAVVGHPDRVGADVDGVGDGVGGRVDHRHVVTAVVGDVDVGAVVGHPVRGVADADGVGDGVGCRVDHRHVVTAALVT